MIAECIRCDQSSQPRSFSKRQWRMAFIGTAVRLPGTARTVADMLAAVARLRRLLVLARLLSPSPFIPANGRLGCSHRGMLNVSWLGFDFFFSFELPYLKASKKAHLRQT